VNTPPGAAENAPPGSARGGEPRTRAGRWPVVVAVVSFVAASTVVVWQLTPALAWLGIPLGRYKTSPNPCELVSDEAAARLVPRHSRHPDPTRPPDQVLSVLGCSWGTPTGASGSAGIAELYVRSSVFHTGGRAAEKAYRQERVKVPATDLGDVGEQAYVTTSIRPVSEADFTDQRRTTRAVVVARDDNLMLRVEYVHIPPARTDAGAAGRDLPSPAETRARTAELARLAIEQLRADVD
jgi:hypothetical protein